MPRSLISRWFCIAKSGPTVDGREITKQEIIDMSETYSLDTYTANIFPEHERWDGTLGSVYEVKHEPSEDGEIKLFARLRPNDYFLWLNDQAQKMFGSVEITPNFAGTGKAYLTGLGATDSPASLACQEFYFSRRVKQTPQTTLYSQNFEIPKLRSTTTNPIAKAFNQLCKAMGFSNQQLTHFTQLIEDEPNMTPEQLAALQALIQQQVVLTNGFSDFYAQFSSEAAEPTQEQADAVAQTADAVDTVVETATDAPQSDFNRAMLAELKAMRQDFSKVLSGPANNRNFSASTPVADTQKPKAGLGHGAL